VVLPAFDATGNLPPGIHPATWDEVTQRFGWNARRQELLGGLRRGLVALADASCRLVYLDGSFVTAKERPGDFDACYEIEGMVFERLDRVFLHFENGRAAQKLKYGGEFFPSHLGADGVHRFVEFFQIDKESGKPKGIVAITPGSTR
jgi:hypothetical protein